MIIPRPEHPNPIFQRQNWQNLNGIWQFYCKEVPEKREILVPFCPESTLSGVEYTGFMKNLVYSRPFAVPKGWRGKNIILHFGAVDYHAAVYINGILAGTHKGGYTPFEFDITAFVHEGENILTVNVTDDLMSGKQPSGKQSKELNSYGCFYTRTTGIWQTVWLEAVPEKHIKTLKTTTDMAGNVRLEVETTSSGVVSASVCYAGREIVKTSGEGIIKFQVPEIHLWDVGQGNLYDLTLTYGEDTVYSYFGLRSVELKDGAFLLNGRKVFGRWVLDQGFYPDGVYTAPTDEELQNDIIYSMRLGFNGARLHQKIFEPRFLYHADRLGYMVWGEHANWGLDISYKESVEHFLPEWLECLARDYSHPAIIGWCPFNETWDYEGKIQCDEVLRIVYNKTKKFDRTRPVIDTSGNYHVVTDIFDIHDYNQSINEFSNHYEGNKVFLNFTERQTYNGEPYFVSEYGGIKWSDDETGWGYGDAPKSREEFLDRYTRLTTALLNNKNVLGFCYTQLYDIEQEQNGLLTYRRDFKFNPEIIYKINTQKAAIED